MKVAPKMGEGIFLTKDVSDILRLPYHKVRHLMQGYWNAEQFGDSSTKAVNFYALIEFYTFFKLREMGVTATEIKKAHNILRKDLNVKYPFALSGINSDGKKLWYKNLTNIIKVDGKQQTVIELFISEFLHKVDFGGDNLAQRFYPINNSKLIVVDPKHQFGQPTISGRNITISAIKKLHDGGEAIKDIAELYSIKSSQVSDALSYFKKSA